MDGFDALVRRVDRFVDGAELADGDAGGGDEAGVGGASTRAELG